LRWIMSSSEKRSEATLLTSSSGRSSNETKTPGSPMSSAPRTRNSIEKSVLPHPAEPHTSVGRPRGSPPSVTWSKPVIPVGHLGSAPADRPPDWGGRAGRESCRVVMGGSQFRDTLRRPG
jgi:hypothetical protein